jgi:MutS domain V
MEDMTNSTAGSAPQEAIHRYTSELDIRNSQFDRLAQRDAQLGTIRVVLFLALLLFLFVGPFAKAVVLFGSLAAIAFVAFLGVAIYNESIRDAMEQLRSQRRVLRRLLARLQRDWKRLSENGPARLLSDLKLPKHQREVADDLDLFGDASLFQLTAMVGTKPGAETLARWLAEPADADASTRRATAISQLAPQRDVRLNFYVTAHQIGESTGHPDRFVAWASGPLWLDQRAWMKTWANVSAVIAGVAIVALLVGWLVPTFNQAMLVAGVVLFVLAGVNFAITSIFLGPAHEIFSIAMANRRSVADYRSLTSTASLLRSSKSDQALQAASGQTSGDLESIYDRLVGGEKAADAALASLAKVAGWGSLRQSAATFLIYLPLQAFTLWDVRVLDWLETWQRRFGAYSPAWFAALGELEALMSLAALRDEYPHWATPSWVKPTSDATVQATGIGHPLLRDDVRVCNDVTVGPSGSFLLVTGSNMSGKSTLLRSLGLNVSLANTGAPVCATSLSLPAIQLATSIRVRDNLAEGVSFYMAELHRLRGVVDQARQVADRDDRVLMFLLDEILQGTNSRERQIAVSQVLETLVEYRAIGAISTHDLELADEATLKQLATIVHFRETIHPDAEGVEQMTFDYQMRPGVSPTTNALRLLEIVGLGRKST